MSASYKTGYFMQVSICSMEIIDNKFLWVQRMRQNQETSKSTISPIFKTIPIFRNTSEVHVFLSTYADTKQYFKIDNVIKFWWFVKGCKFFAHPASCGISEALG